MNPDEQLAWSELSGALEADLAGTEERERAAATKEQASILVVSSVLMLDANAVQAALWLASSDYPITAQNLQLAAAIVSEEDEYGAAQ